MEKTTKAYTVFAIIITGTALFLVNIICKVLFFGARNVKSLVRKKPVLFAWLLLLIPNITVAVVYFAEHIQILLTSKEPESGAWCSFVAFTAIVAMVCMNGSCLTIACVMYQIVMHGPKGVWRTILGGNAASWFSGIAVGCWYLASKALGPYRGMYCCIGGERYNGPRIILIFGSFGFSIFAQMYLYFRSFLEIKKTEEKVKNQSSVVHVVAIANTQLFHRYGQRLLSLSNEKSSQNQCQVQSTSRIFMKKGILLVSVYYLCWLWISVDALLVFRGFEPPMYSSIVAALLAKLNSVIHCAIILRHIIKAKSTVYAAQPAQHT